MTFGTRLIALGHPNLGVNYFKCYCTLVSIAQKIFSKKFELAVSKARLKSNLDDNTIQSGKKSWKKVENGGI